MSSAKELMHAIGERISLEANVKRVYGDPITVEGRTIIPVASVRYGFGAGSRGSRSPANGDGGGGGGGRLQAVPVGVLEISGDRTRFLHFNPWKPMAISAAVGFLLGAMTARRR